VRLPDPQLLFPANTTGAIVRFWIGYWLIFFALLPWMLLRQVWVTSGDLLAAVWTAGRRWRLLDGDIEIGFVGCAELLVTSGMFGERFTWVRHRDVVIDPGPANARAEVLAALDGADLTTVAITHFHEEHIGNATAVASRHDALLLGSAFTLEQVRQPDAIPEGRRLLMGQPEPASGARLAELGPEIATARTRLLVIPAAGHCSGHVAFYEPERQILFAGDAFLHEIYTAPNRDSDAAAWITTLERFAALRIATLVGSHNSIRSRDPAVPRIAGVTVRADPDRLIAEKLAFLRWARNVVAEGERRGLPHAVIEACLFPWQRSWSWRTWFHDEGFRLLTCGEFSRTHFVRSLSSRPEQVPVRFPPFARLGARLAVLGPELLRIHVLAARPLPVLVIAGSIGLSAAALLGAAHFAGAELRPGVAALADAGPALVRHHPGWLAGLLACWTWWWAVVGGGITRVMGLAVVGAPAESLATAMRHCLSPALYAPSLLASLCLLAVACAPSWPWPLLAVPPVWLVAGMLYGATCMDQLPLGRACATLGSRFASPGRLIARQLAFLCGFAVSTAIAYTVAAAWWAVAAWLGGGWTASGTLALAAPALVYAIGYTTANLKSLQLWLYARP
jgi:hydroxyacylglutathione hydrolase